MAYEPKYWDCGGSPAGIDDAIAEFVDENVCEALARFMSEMVKTASIDGKGIWLIDTYLPDNPQWCLSVKKVVDRSIKMYSGEGSDESTLEWLREARAHLRECIEALDKVL